MIGIIMETRGWTLLVLYLEVCSEICSGSCQGMSGAMFRGVLIMENMSICFLG
ncbi:hypothetical protein MKX01_011416 [Papaver californicum]|nr:hypothetical protein MKX01_011416 [Papaver californicum]